MVKAEVPTIEEELTVSLGLIEGCTPIDDIKPTEHRFIHYPKLTLSHSSPENLWMMSFERYNKFLKNHVHNAQHPEINLAKNSAKCDTATFYELSEEDTFDLPEELHHR